MQENLNDLGYSVEIPYNGERYDGGYGYGHHLYDGVAPYNNGNYYKGKKGGRHHHHGGYGPGYNQYDPFHFIPPFEGKDSNTKYLDENPKY